MMKILKTVAIVSGLTVAALTTAVSANAGQMSFTKADNSTASNLCYAALRGNRANMHKEIKATGLSKSFVIDNVTCNNMSIGSFVAQYGSESMQNMIPQTTKVRVIDIAAKSSMSGHIEMAK